MTIEQIIRDAIHEGIRESMPVLVAEVLAKVAPLRPQTTTPNRKLSPKEAAALVGVGEKAVRQWVKDGELPAGRAGRKIVIDPRDLEAFLKRTPTRTTTATTTDELAAKILGQGR